MMAAASRFGRGRQRGVALIAVLWIVAALGILVTGMVQAHRDEIRLVASARQTVRGSSLANAAIQLVLQDMAARGRPLERLTRTEVGFDGVNIVVEIVPMNGLIDINRAPQPLLEALFSVAGQVNADQASALAKAVVEARAPGPLTLGGPRFEAAEDLLQVPGVDYSLYARLLPFVTTDASGGGRVNTMAAPEGVLLILAGGDSGRAARIAAGRDSGATGVDTTDLPAQLIDAVVGSRFRLVAHVPLPDGRRLLGTRMVETRRVAPDGVPWRIFAAEDRFEPNLATKN
jgi:general secretion pathway protein K